MFLIFMAYKTKIDTYDAVSSGTAGIAQRISSYKATSELEEVETMGLVALAKNDVMACAQNQF
jgi:hypothetical protein